MIWILLRAILISAALSTCWALIVATGRWLSSLLQGRRLDRSGGAR